MLTCRDKHTHPFCPSRLSVAADKKEQQQSDLLRLTAQYCGLSLKANALNVIKPTQDPSASACKDFNLFQEKITLKKLEKLTRGMAACVSGSHSHNLPADVEIVVALVRKTHTYTFVYIQPQK